MAKVLLLGDILLDQYINCTPIKISEEAPVLVGREKDYSYYLGGAGNLAINLKNLGVDVDIIRVISHDTAGYMVDELLAHAGINAIRVHGDCPPSIVKTRYMLNNHQVIRIDKEILGDKDYSLNNIDFSQYDAIAISDYAKGFFNAKIADKLNFLLLKCPTIVNGKPKNIELYRGVDYLIINEKETNQIILENNLCGVSEICQKFSILYLITTRGSRGLAMYSASQTEPILDIEGEDIIPNSVVGAGDTVTAGVIYGIVNDMNKIDMLKFANHIAAIKCTKKETEPIKLEDIKNSGE